MVEERALAIHQPQIHIVFENRTYDMDINNLNMDIGDLSTDDEIRRSVANELNAPETKFDLYNVDRNLQTGDITLRPQAVFGTAVAEDSSVDQRVDMLNSLLTCPHRNLGAVLPIHQQIMDTDPIFYARLSAWYTANGNIRDHQQMFIIQLCMSNEFRNEGLAMLRELPMYQVVRVVDFVHNELKRNIPNSMVTEVTRYLREREGDADWFASNVLQARKGMKRLYALLHIKPSEDAQAVLFDDSPPEGSRLEAIRQLRKAADPAEQAQIVIDAKIPYRVASTVVKSMTPTVMLALIEVMSDQELINNIGSLRKRGVLDNPELHELVNQRLANAHKSGRVDTIKASQAAKAAGADEETTQALADVTNKKLETGKRITKNTALLVDKSFSMRQGIEVSKHIGSLIGAVTDADLFVYAFDTMATPITRPRKNGIEDWEAAFRGIRDGGATSCGIGIQSLAYNNQDVDQIIMVTDQGENNYPRFYGSLVEYQQKVGHPVSVIFVDVGRSSKWLEDYCRNNDIEYSTYSFSGDYYSLSNLIPLLTAPSKQELLMEIMSTPLPERRSA